MRTVGKWLAALVVSLGASYASGGLVVTSYQTLASTNGYAPTNQSQYFAEQRLENVSPALAEVSGDWTGPNANGTPPNTWHFVGASQARSTTTITPDSYTVEAAATFEYVLDTVAEFVDPASVSIYGPGGTGQHRAVFETNMESVYSINVLLTQRARVRLDSFSGIAIFNESISSTGSSLVQINGVIPAGRYQLLATTGVGIGNQPAGNNHIERSGSFENLVFTVRVPEPSWA